MLLKDYIKFLQNLPEQALDTEVMILRGENGPTPVEDYDLPDLAPVYAYAPSGTPTSDEGPVWHLDLRGAYEKVLPYVSKMVVLL
jgi:hypothetical protein